MRAAAVKQNDKQCDHLPGWWTARLDKQSDHLGTENLSLHSVPHYCKSGSIGVEKYLANSKEIAIDKFS